MVYILDLKNVDLKINVYSEKRFLRYESDVVYLITAIDVIAFSITYLVKKHRKLKR
jgi:hypothetical protein